MKRIPSCYRHGAARKNERGNTSPPIADTLEITIDPPRNRRLRRDKMPIDWGGCTMDISEAINQRKSIRAFKPDPIPRDILKKINFLFLRLLLHRLLLSILKFLPGRTPNRGNLPWQAAGHWMKSEKAFWKRARPALLRIYLVLLGSPSAMLTEYVFWTNKTVWSLKKTGIPVGFKTSSIMERQQSFTS